MSGTWYLARGKSKVGPFTLIQLREFASAGDLKATDMVWQAGAAKWQEAREVSAIFLSSTTAYNATSSRKQKRLLIVKVIAIASAVAATVAFVLFPIDKPRHPKEEVGLPAIQDVEQPRQGSYDRFDAPNPFLAHDGAKSEDDPDSISVLVAVLSDKKAEKEARAKAVETLGKLGHKAKTALPALTQALKDEQFEVRVNASRALASIGSEALPWLFKALADKDARARANGAAALANIPVPSPSREKDFAPWAEGVPLLIEGLKDSDGSVRRQVIHVVGRLGRHAKAAVPALSKILETDIEDAEIVAKTLASLGPTAKEAVPVLLKTLTSEDPGVRVQVAYALGQIRSDTKASVAGLSASLNDLDPVVRMFAAEALGFIGPEAKPALPSLIKCLRDENSLFSGVSAKAILAIDPSCKRTIPGIEQKLKGAPRRDLTTFRLSVPEFTRTANEANALRAKGAFIASIKLYEKVISMAEDIFGSESEVAAVFANSLAGTCCDAGLYGRAEATYRRCLPMWVDIFGGDSEDVGAMLYNYGRLSMGLGRYVQAEEMLARSRAIFTARLGTNHSNVRMTIHMLGEVYRMTGDYQGERIKTYLVAHRVT